MQNPTGSIVTCDSVEKPRHEDRRGEIAWYDQGRNEGGKGGTILRESLRGAPKSPRNVTCRFFNTVNLLPKDIKFEHWGAKLASCPGRHLTLCPWVLCRCMKRHGAHSFCSAMLRGPDHVLDSRSRRGHKISIHLLLFRPMPHATHCWMETAKSFALRNV